jgi:hypothetical protein
VRGLPDQPGRPEQRSDPQARPQPAAAQHAAGPGDHQADPERGEQEGDQGLVEQREPRDNPAERPQPLVAGAHHPGHHPGERCPREQVERGGAEQVTDNHDHGGDGDAAGRDDLGTATSAQLEGEGPGHQHRAGGHQRRRDPKHRQRAGRDRVHHMRHQRRQGTLIGKGPIEVIAGDQEVELVAVIPVAARERDQDHDDEARNTEQSAERQTGLRTRGTDPR